jgi:hypothetical protein
MIVTETGITVALDFKFYAMGLLSLMRQNSRRFTPRSRHRCRLANLLDARRRQKTGLENMVNLKWQVTSSARGSHGLVTWPYDRQPRSDVLPPFRRPSIHLNDLGREEPEDR